MRTLFLVLPLLTASAAYAQLEPATVYNATSDAPVAITGNVTCSEEIKDSRLYITAAGELTFTNISSRNIVQLEVAATLKCTRGPARLIQYHHSSLFFMAHGLPIGEGITKSVPLDSDEEGSPLDTNSAPTLARVDVETVFVQFEDGSTWGDSGLVGELRRRRKDIEALLTRLALAANDREFDTMLTDALSTEKSPYAMTAAYKISLVREQSGTESARVDVRERLRVAREREASGNF